MASLREPSSSEVLGVLTSVHPTNGRRRHWNLTGSDALWLARMLRAEDGSYSDPEEGYRVGRVMLSMILRRLAVVFFDGPYSSVTHLLRGDESGRSPKGWSEPLRWTGLRFPSSPEKLALYQRAQARTWAELPDYYRRAVLDTLTGRVGLVAPSVVDAAAPEFTARRMADPAIGGAAGWRREHHGTRSWLISTTRSRSWPESNVYIGGSGGAFQPSLLALALVGGLGAALAWRVYA